MQSENQQITPVEPTHPPVPKQILPVFVEEYGLNIMQLGKVFADSKYFKDAVDANRAMVKIMAGHELGIGPIASMQSIYVFEGNISLHSSLRAALIRSKGMGYHVDEHTADTCTVRFFNRTGEDQGTWTYTTEDARNAGLLGKDNWKKDKKLMLFYRALSQGQRVYLPEATNGLPVYDPDEVDDIIVEAKVVSPALSHAKPAVDKPVPKAKGRLTPEEWAALRNHKESLNLTDDAYKAWLDDHFGIAPHEVTPDIYDAVLGALKAFSAVIIEAPAEDLTLTAPEEILNPFEEEG